MPKQLKPLSLRELSVNRIVVDFELINYGSHSYTTNFNNFNNNGNFVFLLFFKSEALHSMRWFVSLNVTFLNVILGTMLFMSL